MTFFDNSDFVHNNEVFIMNKLFKNAFLFRITMFSFHNNEVFQKWRSRHKIDVFHKYEFLS